MYATASLETRKALTASWEDLEELRQRYDKLNEIDLSNLSAKDKKLLVDLREKICLYEFNRVESPSLRIQKFLHIGDNSKRFECDALVKISKYPNNFAERFHISTQTPDEVRFILKLQSRMMLNHTGGILENAGLCLHPHAGVPFIPGSAIKGVSRHAAWCEWADAVDEGRENGARDSALKLALAFGFPTNDKRLDAYCKEQWPEWFGDKGTLETLAGLVAFMPAMPMQKTELVTDIVNGHHSDYYLGSEPRALGNGRLNPQFFPAVEKGSMFTFIIRPLRRCERVLDTMSLDISKSDLRRFAESSLRSAAIHLGFGAKTSSGYGWFEEDKVLEQAPAKNAQRKNRKPWKKRSGANRKK